VLGKEARNHNENLPGMGGVFNAINLNVYHYAGNNPVKYTDPDGRENETVNWWKEILDIFLLDVKVGLSFDVAFISKIGIDLFSKGAKFSTEGYQEVITAGINIGIIGLNITAPDYTPEISGLKLFAEQGKVSLNIGPVIIDENGISDVSLSFGGSVLVGVYLNISLKEIGDLFIKIGDVLYGEE